MSNYCIWYFFIENMLRYEFVEYYVVYFDKYFSGLSSQYFIYRSIYNYATYFYKHYTYCCVETQRCFTYMYAKTLWYDYRIMWYRQVIYHIISPNHQFRVRFSNTFAFYCPLKTWISFFYFTHNTCLLLLWELLSAKSNSFSKLVHLDL